MKHIIFTVTNDLSYDQRMIRICNTLAARGYGVKLLGVKKSASLPLAAQPFIQKRLAILFKKGPGFYLEYNTRLFFYLLFSKADAYCCIDLDTIMPVYFISRLKGKKRVYDAHEYFSQLKEVIRRPRVYRFWHWVEKTFVPKFKAGYTVSQSIAEEFQRLYRVDYACIRNMPVYKEYVPSANDERVILYQGAVNEARGLESLIPAMKEVGAKLWICGNGNFFEQAKALVKEHGLQEKIFMSGMLSPEKLEEYTSKAYIGINPVENTGLNQYYSLANKFFDYIQHGIPQVTMNFPEYADINKLYEVAVLIDDTDKASITKAIDSLLNDDVLYARLKQQCGPAAKELNWDHEEKKLLTFYKNIFE